MSQFSDRLKMLLDESGTNVYQLSRNAKLDRTTIQRALKGERLPSISFVGKLCDYLRVSPAQRSELIELYTVSRVGEKVYAGRKYIKDMIERMAAVHTKPDNSFIGQRAIKIDDIIESGFKTISGQFNVQNLIRDVLEDEAFNSVSPHIYLNVPFENTFLFDLLYQLFLNSNRLSNDQKSSEKLLIKHIIKLSKNPHSLLDSNYNLKILSNVLPFAFCEWGSYEPYYYYGNVEDSKGIDSVFPYYIITGRYLIQLSSDFNIAVLCGNNEIFNIFFDAFEKSLIHSKALLKQLISCGEMLEAYVTAYKEAGEVSHAIMSQPGFGMYYTDELVEAKLRQDVENREAIKPLICQLYSDYRNFSRLPMDFFSIEGIEFFIKTGMMTDLPPQYAIPFSIDERKMLLEQFKNDIINDIYPSRAVNSCSFAFSLTTLFQLYGSNFLLIAAVNSSGMMSAVFIEERNICEAFFDFFNSLPESDLLLSKEETIKIIDEAVTKLAAI